MDHDWSTQTTCCKYFGKLLGFCLDFIEPQIYPLFLSFYLC